MRKIVLIGFFQFLFCFIALAQEETSDKEELTSKDERKIIELSENSKPTIELNPSAVKEDKEKTKTEKKRKSNVFYGIKTKKRVVKTVEGKNTTYEIFYVLREFKESNNKFADDFFYYDEKERKIVKTDKPTKDVGMPLHGTYKKLVNGEVVLNGIFYLGTRHGRWEQYNKNGRLLDKKKYYEGFARESEISYWDGAQTKIKEVIPIHFGYKDGTYLRFYESGRLAEKGIYKEDTKIGLWVEFFDKASKNNTKRQTKYPDDPFEKTAPVVIKEWDENGNQIVGKSDEWKDQHKHKKGKKSK
ncbi:MAG: hypothetical protein OHK0038_03280 [Flammeovirgaceae bacterium]